MIELFIFTAVFLPLFLVTALVEHVDARREKLTQKARSVI